MPIVLHRILCLYCVYFSNKFCPRTILLLNDSFKWLLKVYHEI
jgi:hypothetical protein